MAGARPGLPDHQARATVATRCIFSCLGPGVNRLNASLSSPVVVKRAGTAERVRRNLALGWQRRKGVTGLWVVGRKRPSLALLARRHRTRRAPDDARGVGVGVGQGWFQVQGTSHHAATWHDSTGTSPCSSFSRPRMPLSKIPDVDGIAVTRHQPSRPPCRELETTLLFLPNRIKTPCRCQHTRSSLLANE